ncbi:MAG TPA: hypothetical protein VF771_18130 [Longimicrobiaceae bacterium]
MKKVKLDIEELSVDSFDTTAREKEGKGTVFAHFTLACSQQFTCDEAGCNTIDTCGMGSCGATCGGVCGDTTYEINNCTANGCEMM